MHHIFPPIIVNHKGVVQQKHQTKCFYYQISIRIYFRLLNLLFQKIKIQELEISTRFKIGIDLYIDISLISST